MSKKNKKLKKSRSSFSSDPLILQQFETAIDNSPNWDSKSEWFQEQMEMFVNSDNSDLEKEENRIKQELSQVEQEIYEKQQEKEQLMNELKQVQAQRQAKEQAEKEQSEDLKDFKEAFFEGEIIRESSTGTERKRPLKEFCHKPEDIPDKYSERLGKSKEELFEIVRDR